MNSLHSFHNLHEIIQQQPVLQSRFQKLASFQKLDRKDVAIVQISKQSQLMPESLQSLGATTAKAQETLMILRECTDTVYLSHMQIQDNLRI